MKCKGGLITDRLQMLRLATLLLSFIKVIHCYSSDQLDQSYSYLLSPRGRDPPTVSTT